MLEQIGRNLEVNQGKRGFADRNPQPHHYAQSDFFMQSLNLFFV